LPSFIRNPKDFLTGLLFIVFSIAFVVIARDYPMGTAARMQSGYFPTVLGWLLGVIGIITLARSFFMQGEPIKGFTLKGLLIVTGSSLLFGFLIRPAGLAVAIPIYVMVSAYASKQFNWKASIILAIALTVFSILIFVKGLALPIPVIGSWFGG
jgi:putative tricarboxylic transport membrane protein